MTTPADANPTQTPAKTDAAKPDAAKTKPSRIWYPTQREMVASHVMASLLEGARGPAPVPEQTLVAAAATAVAAADALIKALENPADLV